MARYAKSGDLHIAYIVEGDGPIDLVWIPPWISQVEYLWSEASLERGDGAADPLRAGDHLRPARLGPVRPALRRAHARGADGRRAGGDGRRRLRERRDLRHARGRPDGRAVRRHLPGPHRARWSSTPRSPAPPGRPATSGPGPPRSATRTWTSCVEHWGEGWVAGCVAPSRMGDPRFMEWAGRLERLAASPATISRIFDLIGEFDVRDVLPSIRVPTLVMHRRDDSFIKVEHSRYIAEQIPGARYVELEGGDNMFSVGDSEAILGRDRGVPHRHAPRARARPHARHGDVHRHRATPPSAPPRWATAAGASCSSATTRSSGRRSSATAAARSSAPATASWPPSTARRARSAAPPPWPRRWDRSGWRCAPASTRASSR